MIQIISSYLVAATHNYILERKCFLCHKPILSFLFLVEKTKHNKGHNNGEHNNNNLIQYNIFTLGRSLKNYLFAVTRPLKMKWVGRSVNYIFFAQVPNR